MKQIILSLVILGGCGSSPSFAPIDTPSPSTSVVLITPPSVPPIDSQFDASAMEKDCGTYAADSSTDAGTTDSQDASALLDSAAPQPDAATVDATTCAPSTTVVGHCVSRQGTLCQEYVSNEKAQCENSPMVTGWFDGPCGSESESELFRSLGACQDSCGVLSYGYRLGGALPTAETKQFYKTDCESVGKTYLP